MLSENIRIDDDGVKSAKAKSDTISSNLEDALQKGKNLREYINSVGMEGESIESLKALIDLTVQLQEDITEAFEKHTEALDELSKNMDNMDSNSEIITIESI